MAQLLLAVGSRHRPHGPLPHENQGEGSRAESGGPEVNGDVWTGEGMLGRVARCGTRMVGNVCGHGQLVQEHHPDSHCCLHPGPQRAGMPWTDSPPRHQKSK